MGASSSGDGFKVAPEDDGEVEARRIILAGGVKDILTAIPGLAERWGKTVLHCSYCHGYELNEAPIGVLGSTAMSFHQAMIIRDWGPTTLFTQSSLVLTADQRSALNRRDIAIEDTPISGLVGDGHELDAVRLTDDRLLHISGLYLAPRTEVVGDLAKGLGCNFEEGPTGSFISVDEQQFTSVPGVFAAGDAAATMGNATLAAAAGVKAGSAAHFSLVF